MYFRVNDIGFDVNDSVFSGNEQQKVYIQNTKRVCIRAKLL